MPTLVKRVLQSTGLIRARRLSVASISKDAIPYTPAAAVSNAKENGKEHARKLRRKRATGLFSVAAAKQWAGGASKEARRRSQSLTNVVRPELPASVTSSTALPGYNSLNLGAVLAIGDSLPSFHTRASPSEECPQPQSQAEPQPELAEMPASDTVNSISSVLSGHSTVRAEVASVMYTEGIPDFPPSTPTDSSGPSTPSVGSTFASRRSFITIDSEYPIPRLPVEPSVMHADSYRTHFLLPFERRALGWRDDESVRYGVPPPLPMSPSSVSMAGRQSMILYDFQTKPASML